MVEHLIGNSKLGQQGELQLERTNNDTSMLNRELDIVARRRSFRPQAHIDAGDTWDEIGSWK